MGRYVLAHNLRPWILGSVAFGACDGKVYSSRGTYCSPQSGQKAKRGYKEYPLKGTPPTIIFLR